MKPEFIWILGTALEAETGSTILIALIGLFILLLITAIRQKRGQGGFFRRQPGAWSLVQPFEE